jgi:hypothetical protein
MDFEREEDKLWEGRIGKREIEEDRERALLQNALQIFPRSKILKQAIFIPYCSSLVTN